MASVLFCTVCAVIYLVIIAEISIVQTYLQLCEQNYKWQWQSFQNGASPALFLFGLSLFVKAFFSRTSGSASEFCAQLLSMWLICATIALIGASVAFIASLKFNQFLYSKLAKHLD